MWLVQKAMLDCQKGSERGMCILLCPTYIYIIIYIYMYVCIIPLNSSYIPVFLAFPQWFPVHSPRVLRAAHRRELNASRIDLEREVHGDSTRKQWKDPPFSMGKPTISMGYSIIAMLNYQRVTGVISLVLYHDLLLVGGFKHVLFHILGIIIPNDLLFHSYLVK